MKNFSFILFNALAILANICACTDSNVAGGISEETEGIVAVNNKTIKGVSQKGPFAKGSSVFLKETRKDGSLTPTGKEFFATIRNDAGEFKIDNINLESQYALLTAEGYYKRESTSEFSDCSIILNAATDISNRNSTNINLLTHFEYQRILNLVGSGMTFKKAKAQAEKEIFAQFGFEKHEFVAEDLDITGQTEEDRILYEVSRLVDRNFHVGVCSTTKACYSNEYKASCEDVRALIENIANDFATDGIINEDSMLEKMTAYYFAYQKSNNTNMISQFEGLDKCSEDKFKELVKLQKTITLEYATYEYPRTILHFEYAICNGNSWYLFTKEEYEEATREIEHQTSTMTDPRDGKTYKTTSFTTDGITYEWMAENLQFTGYSTIQNEEHDKGIYTRVEALHLEDSAFIKQYLSVLDGTSSVYQGICPEHWHIPNEQEWKALIEYVGSPSKLYSKNWNKVHFTKKLLNDNIEFGAEPTFFESFAKSHDSFVPYANFIVFSPINIKDNYLPNAPESSNDLAIETDATYIQDNQPIKKTRFLSVLLGSTRLKTDHNDEPPFFEYQWLTNYKVVTSMNLGLKVNVRCIKN